jgi:DNA-binding beta-propeller fold protein YncE
LGLAALLALLFGTNGARANDAMPLVAEKPIVIPGAAAKFDYMNVDSEKRRLLAAHPGDNSLAVFDLKTNQFIASLPLGTVQGIIVDAARDQYITGNSKDQKVVFVNRETLKATGEVPTNGPCDDIVLDPKTSMVYADHDDGTDVWVIDARSRKLVGSVTIPEAPEFVLYDPITNRIYQNIKSDGTVQVIDPATNKVETVWHAAESAHGLAVDGKHGRVYSAGGKGKMVVFDIHTGKSLGEIDIAPGTDQIAYDAEMQRVYCASKGFISVVQATPEGAKLIANVPSPAGAHTIAVDPRTHSVWVCYADKEHSYVQEFKAAK